MNINLPYYIVQAICGLFAPESDSKRYRYIELSTPFLSTYSKGTYHTDPIYCHLHHHSPQPHLHHSAEPWGRHSNDSDPLLARTFWEHLTLQQSSQSVQCNTNWTSVLVQYLLQFWHTLIWLWCYLHLYIQYQFYIVVIIHCDKWSRNSFNKYHRG